MSLRELFFLALFAAGTASAARADEPLTPGAVVERALAQNADVRAAEAEVRAVKARLEGASVPLASNPELSGAAGSRDGGAGRTLDYEVALSQRVEIGGQRGARVAVARAALGAAEARLVAAKVRIAAEIRELLERVDGARLRAEVAAEALGLAEQAARAAEKRFQVGDVARIEVNSARVERGRATRAAIEAEQERLAAVAELELALGIEPGTAPEIAFRLEGESHEAERAPVELVREAIASRRDVAAARLDVTAAEFEASLAARSVVPTPALGFSVAREEKASVVLGTLSIELPLFARNQGGAGRCVGSHRAGVGRAHGARAACRPGGAARGRARSRGAADGRRVRPGDDRGTHREPRPRHEGVRGGADRLRPLPTSPSSTSS